MANQDFDLKGWMQQNKQGVYKNSLNENYVDLQPINSPAINEDEDEVEKIEPKKIYVAVVQGSWEHGNDYFEAFTSENPAEVKAKMKASPIYGKEGTTTGMASAIVDLPYIGVNWGSPEVLDASNVTIEGTDYPYPDLGEYNFVMSSETPNMITNRTEGSMVKKWKMDNGRMVSADEEELDEASAEAVDRMEGLANQKALEAFKKIFPMLVRDWMEDGFDQEDILEYVSGVGGFSTKHPFYAGMEMEEAKDEEEM